MDTKKLQKNVTHLIMISLSLTFSQKLDLVGMLSRLNETQLEQVKEVFENDNQVRTEVLKQLFETDPELPQRLHEEIEKQNKNLYKGLEEWEQKQDEAGDVLKEIENLNTNQ